jgi:pilus assembly protein CpaB
VKKARLIVLLIAVSAGAVALWLAGRIEPQVVEVPASAPAVQTTDVLVAARALEPGQRLQAADLRWQAWPTAALPSDPIARSQRGNAIGELQGALVRSAIMAGDPIREDRLIKADGSGYMAALVAPGMRAVATEITPENGVGGFVLPNDRVDVILTRAEKLRSGGEIYVSETILSDVRVLAIDHLTGEKAGQRVAVGKIATLELSPGHAERLALARRLGTISLALRGLAEQRPAGGASDTTPAINIVRFGVASPSTLR